MNLPQTIKYNCLTVGTTKENCNNQETHTDMHTGYGDDKVTEEYYTTLSETKIHGDLPRPSGSKQTKLIYQANLELNT